MGKVNNTPEVNHAPTMKHFSHPHELELCNTHNPPQGRPYATLCSGCKLPPSGIIYICRPCNFILHLICAEFPKLITHPSHSGHTLTLLPTSTYPGGKFNCDACNNQGDGFSYHCSLCDFDLHVICATKPLKISHQLHRCQLELTFQNPYNNSKGFSCDICSRMGSQQWLYRCHGCEFDVHLDCATATARPRSTIQAQAMIQHYNSFPGVTLHNQFQAPINASQGVGSVRPSHHMHSASMGAIPTYQNQFQAPINASQGVGSVRPGHYMHSASVGASSRYQNQFQSPMAAGQVYGSAMPNQLMHSASTGSMPNYQPPTGTFQNYQPPTGTFQNYQASRTDGLMNAAMQGLVEGAAQQVGQTLIQGIIGGGANDSSLLGSVFGDSSDTQSY